MPERNFRKSPARAAAAAAAAQAAATAAALNSVSSRRSPARRSGRSPSRTGKSPSRQSRKSPSRDVEKSQSRHIAKSPSRRNEKSPSRRVDKSPSRRIDKSPSRHMEKSPSRHMEKSPSRHTERSPRRSSRKSPVKKSNQKRSPGPKPRAPLGLSSEFLVAHKEEIIQQPRVKLVNHDWSVFESSSFRERSREPSTSSSSIIIRRPTRITAEKEFEARFEDKKGIEQIKEADETELQYPEKPVSQEKSEEVMEFGGPLGVLLIEIICLFLFVVAHLYISKAQYGVKDFKIPLDWKAYFDIEVAALHIGFIVLQLMLSILPIGKLVDGMPNKVERLQYRCNGFLSAVFTMTLLGVLIFFKFPVTILVEKYIQFLVSGFLFGYILSVLLYIRGGRAHIMAQNPFAMTGNHIYDFWMGREINPRVGPFDVKVGLTRIGVIGLIMTNTILVIKSMEHNDGYSPTLLVAAGLQIWYSLDYLWFEDSFLASFEFMYEGTGFMLAMGYNIYPFIPTIITRFILNYRLEIPLYAIGVIVVVNAVGYVIYRGSNLQKSEFRKNPLNPALAHLETIPTSRGKKLLVSGWWGWVRHPNYLGDIVICWSWASTCGLAHPLPYLVPLFTTALLLNRAKRDESRCRQRYNSAWERYSNRVKYCVIPKVF